MLDDHKTSASVNELAPVAQRIEQRFPKTKQLVANGRRSSKQGTQSAFGLQTGTTHKSFCAPVDLADEYSGRVLRPLWELAQKTGNLVLRKLVLQWELEREGITIIGRRAS